MRKKIWTSMATALALATLLTSSMTAVVMAADGGVKQVTVAVGDAEINPGDTDNITVTVVTGSSIDDWTGTITVTAPAPVPTQKTYQVRARFRYRIYFREPSLILRVPVLPAPIVYQSPLILTDRRR